MKIKYLFLLLVVFSIAGNAAAKVKLQPIFTDNMVLQQKCEAKIWGEASAGKIVKITTSWNHKSYNATADENGGWITSVSTPKAGGPYDITISDEEPLVLKDVLIGEVWVCSGQSNMELRMVDHIIGSDKEFAEAGKYKNIRLLHVENNYDVAPSTELKVRYGGWLKCTSYNITDFSAAAYYFGKNLNLALDCPIGLIETCWGGTYAEDWISRESLNTFPYFKDQLDRVSALPPSLEVRQKQFNDAYAIWDQKASAMDKANVNGVLLWSKPDFDDSSWEEIHSPEIIETQGEQDFDGIYWQRKTIDIPANWSGKDLTLYLSTIDDNDVTYFNGVLVGQTVGYNIMRKYVIPGSLVREGKATIAIRVTDTGGAGGIYGDDKDVRIVLSDKDQISLAGAWKFKISLDSKELPKFPVNDATAFNYATALYNAMINPIINYSIRGAIWYQGEANEGRSAQYKDLLPLLINDWRTKWGYSFPFYVVQLPNFRKVQTQPEESSNWAELREAQSNTLNMQNTGVAVTIDIGEAGDIHPKNKSDVGKRLALIALAKTYGKNVEYSGPYFEKYVMESNKIRLYFSHSDGLKASNGTAIKGFTIAGVDHKFYFADAVIDGDTIVVSSDKVAFPVAVRYAWANNPVCNLINGAGLPAGPFRTDNWPRK